MNYLCKYCLLKSTEKLIKKLDIDDSRKDEIASKLFKHVALETDNKITPEIARGIHNIINKENNDIDLFLEEKKVSNELALSKYDYFQSLIDKSDNPLNTALRLAIAGNIMDFAAVPEFFDNSDEYFNDTINKVLNSDFAIDYSKQLFEEIEKAGTILYLGDNAGEIVLDKLFLKTINHPNIYFAVRGKAVINDATIEDAENINIAEHAKLITNGYDAPSTIIDKCSKEFHDIYEKADLIISKGQGNLEGLLNTNDNRIFFLLMIKCSVIGDHLNVKKGDFVVHRF